jgi:hypothetical protein
MAFTWTPKDPLDNTGVTLSIYITELQVNANILRAELSQGNYSFIDQSVGKTLSLNAIEELKTVVNQLAIDFGFSGVADIAILGRPYVEHPLRFGKPAAGFAIINDLRRALDALEEVDALKYATVIWNWYDNGAPTVIPLAAHTATLGNPWSSIPDYIQTGFGGTCPQGYPTCDNTNSGSYRDNILFATDVSIISVSGTVANTLLEGPIGGPYFEVGTSLTNVIHTSAGGARGVDEDYYYSWGGSTGSGGQIYRAPRDGSAPMTLLGDFGISFAFGFVDQDLFVTSTSVILVKAGNFTGPLDYGRMNKTTGAIETLVTGIGAQDLLSTGNGTIDFSWGLPGFEQGGIVYLTYGENTHDFDLTNRLHTVASAVMAIDGNGVPSLDSDLDSVQFLQSPRVPSDPVFYRYGHGFGSQLTLTGISSGNNGGVHVRKRVGGSVIKVGLPAPPDNGEDHTYAGSILSNTDYKGDTINGRQVAYCENYLDHSSGTLAIATPSFDTAVRVNAGSTDVANVTWTPIPGAFRYRLQRRLGTSTLWFTNNTVEASDPGVGTGVITGLQTTAEYGVRIAIETGQGLIIGPETILPVL